MQALLAKVAKVVTIPDNFNGEDFGHSMALTKLAGKTLSWKETADSFNVVLVDGSSIVLKKKEMPEAALKLIVAPAKKPKKKAEPKAKDSE